MKNLTVLRIATSLIFIVSGLGHILRPQQILSQLGKNEISQFVQSMSQIDFLIQASGVPLLAFGLMLLFNKYIRLVSIILILNTAAITLATHLGRIKMSVFKRIKSNTGCTIKPKLVAQTIKCGVHVISSALEGRD